MKVIITLLALLTISAMVDASLLDAFKDEEGRTKWQYVANFSGSVLIILLSVALSSLTVSRFKLRVRNRELKAIKKNLEATVERRTENLNQSNQLLQQSNQLLEGEIAEHKETEKQLISSQNYLSSILSSMPSMLICLNEDMQVTHWNPTAETFSGLKSSEALGKNLWEAYPAITLSTQQVESVLTQRRPIEIKHSQRGQYYFNLMLYPLKNEAGVVILIDNVTQQSLAENMLIQRDKMASVGEMASIMASDINTPLQDVLMEVKAVQEQLTTLPQMNESTDTNATSQVTDRLTYAAERGQQASAIIQNLLDFSSGHSSEKRAEDVMHILDHCIELASNTLAQVNSLHFKDIKIHRQYGDNVPKILCYVGELQQVFISLFRHSMISMAAKKQENYTPTLTIEVMDAYDNVWVKVQHNGVGLSAEEQRDVFEPFVQNLTPANPKPFIPENRLSFPYFIVNDHHQGEMAITSDKDIGTTFHIQFLSHAEKA